MSVNIPRIVKVHESDINDGIWYLIISRLGCWFLVKLSWCYILIH
jgi:hypothetical protein